MRTFISGLAFGFAVFVVVTMGTCAALPDCAERQCAGEAEFYAMIVGLVAGAIGCILGWSIWAVRAEDRNREIAAAQTDPPAEEDQQVPRASVLKD